MSRRKPAWPSNIRLIYVRWPRRLVYLIVTIPQLNTVAPLLREFIYVLDKNVFFCIFFGGEHPHDLKFFQSVDSMLNHCLQAS